MIFTAAQQSSLQGLKQVLHEFYTLSDLQVSYIKSEIFYSGIDDAITSSINLKLGTLPVRYLGVPLVFGKLNNKDCKPLIDKITSRITAWTSWFLSLAGRLQLVNSILTSMYIYWCNNFFLPIKVIRSVESLRSAFLWKGNVSHAKGAKVNWKTMCMPKSKGGLGIKRLLDWNEV